MNAFSIPAFYLLVENLKDWIWIIFAKDHPFGSKIFLGHFLDISLFEFFAGMALYRIYLKMPTKHKINDIIVLGLMSLIIHLVLNFDDASHYSKLMLFFPLFLAKMDSFLFYILNSKIFIFLGEISYSIYLSHFLWIRYFLIKVWLLIFLI